MYYLNTRISRAEKMSREENLMLLKSKGVRFGMFDTPLGRLIHWHDTYTGVTHIRQVIHQ